MHPILIAGKWQSATPVGAFEAFNPQTAEPLGDMYPISDWTDCDAVLQAACVAAEALEPVPPDRIAAFLERFADRLAAAAPEICGQAALETALPVNPRLAEVEMPRTVNQLKQAAQAARNEAWRMPVVDEAADIRSCFGPVGPVLILGPNNFPFAFNAVSGGDFAAAIAAGNPVIAKAHSAHPGTSRLLAEQAYEAIFDCDMPVATVQLLYGLGREDGLRMVDDPRLAAVGFTGSREGGMALKRAADAAGKPIYLEMSSVNPVFLLPDAVHERSAALAAELVGSFLLGVGQFCTCPNLVVLVAGDASEEFLEAIKAGVLARPAGAMLADSTVENLECSIQTLLDAGAEVVAGGHRDEAPGYRFQNSLLRVSGTAFLANPSAMQTEAFGPATLAVVVEDIPQALEVARDLEGSLTGTIYSASDGSDDEPAQRLMAILRRRVGRLLNDKMPTGVAVSPAMNHGGPFPATGHPGFTSVGIPASLRRFAKLDCYDQVRPHRLPKCLRNE